MQFNFIIIVYFLYGLAFFCMGLLVLAEGNRASDLRLRKALRPLAGFGILHGLHEWMEMFDQMERLVGHNQPLIPEFIRLALLAISFVSLIAFGTYLLAYTENAQRIITLVPLGLEAIWVFGLVTFRGSYTQEQIWAVADVWTRYSLAIPGGLLAAIGLIAQQRAFRRSGLVRFGQDALWAAVAFAWYGLVGQLFGKKTDLWLSIFINQDSFANVFGFPVQLFRAIMAIAAAVFVIRFLRAFQVETDQKIQELQNDRVEEAQKREVLKGELYRRIVEAQESERQRIARDLHDETGQSLTAIGMGLRGLESTLSLHGQTPRSIRILRELEEMAANSLDELQRLIADLRPSHLDDLGLPATVRWYANNVKARTDLDITVDITGEEKTICPEYSTSIFRILQEALTNISKHAQATKVRILINFQPDEVRIAVEDNGRGFDVEHGFRQNSWGLLGMQERATLLNGQFVLRSSPHQGTVVEIIIPYCPIHREEPS